MSAPQPKSFLKGLLLIVLFVAGAYLYETSGLHTLLDRQWIDAHIRGQGVNGELLFVLMGSLATAVAVPRQAVSFLGGYAFGFVTGGVLALLATLGGCILTFSFARWFARDLVKARISGKARRIDAFIHDNTFSMTLLIRLLPLGSNMITSLAAGVSSVRAAPFLLGSGLGYIPQTTVFALVGSGIGIEPGMRISLGVLLFVVSGMLGIHLYRRFRRGRHLDAKLEAAIGVEP